MLKRLETVKSSVLRDGDMKRTAGDVLVSPLHNEDVAALLFNGIRDIVHPVAHVFDVHFLAGCLRPVDTDHQHVCACKEKNGNIMSGKEKSQAWLSRKTGGTKWSPALLQSTVKVFFWPMKAFERPAPLEMTLLASEENLGKEAKGLPIATDLLMVSTRTDDVSCKLWPPDRRGPGRRRVRVSFLQQYVEIPSGLLVMKKESYSQYHQLCRAWCPTSA